MTNKEIIDAIEAEIKTTQNLSSKVRLTSTGAAQTILGHMAYINGLRFSKDLLTKRNEANSNVPTWEQTAKDSKQILCESGDLFRECYHKLLDLGEAETASKVLAFCKRAHTCMSSGKKWEDTEKYDATDPNASHTKVSPEEVMSLREWQGAFLDAGGSE